jgi:hypothetical protein
MNALSPTENCVGKRTTVDSSQQGNRFTQL